MIVDFMMRRPGACAKDSTCCPVIVSTADDNYALPLTVMLRSLADNLEWTLRVHVYVLDCGISALNKRRILKSLPAVVMRIHFIPVPMNRLGGLKEFGWFSRSIYARLLLAELLPARIHRVVYIDADTLVLRDIGELWELDLGGKVLGAVLDPMYEREGTVSLVPEADFWGMNAQTPYFNNGLMVIDLDLWKSKNTGERTLGLLQDHPDRIHWAEQEAMNIMLKGEFHIIGPAWNVSWLFYDLPAGTFVGEDGERRKQTYRNPRMIHFWGPNKPWLRPGPAYGADRFFAYLHRTAWRNSVPFAPWKNDPLRKRFRRWLRVWKARILGWRM